MTAINAICRKSVNHTYGRPGFHTMSHSCRSRLKLQLLLFSTIIGLARRVCRWTSYLRNSSTFKWSVGILKHNIVHEIGRGWHALMSLNVVPRHPWYAAFSNQPKRTENTMTAVRRTPLSITRTDFRFFLFFSFLGNFFACYNVFGNATNPFWKYKFWLAHYAIGSNRINPFQISTSSEFHCALISRHHILSNMHL